MFTLLLMLLALSIALPDQGLPAETPRIEKASVKRDFIKTDQRYSYVIDFDFVNTLKQSIEIISLNVFDVSGDRIAQGGGDERQPDSFGWSKAYSKQLYVGLEEQI
jgi:hypothetical protein